MKHLYFLFILSLSFVIGINTIVSQETFAKSPKPKKGKKVSKKSSSKKKKTIINAKKKKTKKGSKKAIADDSMPAKKKTTKAKSGVEKGKRTNKKKKEKKEIPIKKSAVDKVVEKSKPIQSGIIPASPPSVGGDGDSTKELTEEKTETKPQFKINPFQWPPVPEVITKDWKTAAWDEFMLKFQHPFDWEVVTQEQDLGITIRPKDTPNIDIKITYVAGDFGYQKGRFLEMYQKPEHITYWDKNAEPQAEKLDRIKRGWGMFWKNKEGQHLQIRVLELVTGEVLLITLYTSDFKKSADNFRRGSAVIDSLMDYPFQDYLAKQN